MYSIFKGPAVLRPPAYTAQHKTRAKVRKAPRQKPEISNYDACQQVFLLQFWALSLYLRLLTSIITYHQHDMKSQ